MKIKYLYFYVFFGFVFSCGQADKDMGGSTPKKEVIFRFPAIKDTFDLGKYYHETSLSVANYNLYYIGAIGSEIFFNSLYTYPRKSIPELESSPDYQKMFKDHPYNRHQERIKGYFDYLDRSKHKDWEDAKILIQIDTTQKISKYDLHLSKAFRSYPVLMLNLDKDTIRIGTGEYLRLIMEARDSTACWRPIQERFSYFCGTGLNSIILPPKEVALTLAPVFQGPFKTQLRLSVGDNHSAPFAGSINYSQFKSESEK